MSPAESAGLGDLIVVGGGPRALYALADLDDALARSSSKADVRPLRVTVLETGTLGAGAVWDPSQPTHLIMNVDSRIVDATCPSVPLTFRQWHGTDGDPFPPRAEVGRYLAWSFERLRESPRLEVTHRQVRALAIHRETGHWVCETADAKGAHAGPERSRRVLLATGHAGGIGIDHAAIADASRGPGPGLPVVLRGASLTAFDVAMDLTVGRGGEWVEDAAAEYGLRYISSGDEPSSITLASRSGEPMLPKPVAVPAALTSAVHEATSRWASASIPDDAWWEVLADAAMAAAHSAGVRVSREDLWARLGGACFYGAGSHGASAESPDARWGRDVGRAQGDVDGDPAWWWGRAWSAGYTDAVRSLERAPRDEVLWRRWRARAATLERWAFGPPLVTHRRLLALREAGLLRTARGFEVADAGEVGDLGKDVTVIDAFTRGPGIADEPQRWEGAAGVAGPGREPWGSLVADGHVLVRPGERGVLTMPDAACVGASGRVSTGLYALGRPTEDPVIGHDSLQRRLHGDSRRWAETLASEWLSQDEAAPASTAAQQAKVGIHD